MNPAIDNLLVSALRDPKQVLGLDSSGWELIIRQARAAGLAARLAVLLKDEDLFEQVPEQPRNHLDSARLIADKQARSVRWEVRCIRRALSAWQIPFVLLKGSAYVMAKLPAARGRLFSDIDILVPRPQLLQAEKALKMQGWTSTHHDDYDQRYYRQWMHELPPLLHIRRESVLDLHHNILPQTARLQPDPGLLLADARAPAAASDCLVLSPVDMVLHSATHLFYDGELEHGLRDLADLDDLLTHFGKQEGFWSALLPRARILGLTRPLYYSIHFTRTMLGTSVPRQLCDALESERPALAGLMCALLLRALAPAHASCAQRFTGVARFSLYVRSHFLRMPLRLLIPHLLRKTVRRGFGTKME